MEPSVAELVKAERSGTDKNIHREYITQHDVY